MKLSDLLDLLLVMGVLVITMSLSLGIMLLFYVMFPDLIDTKHTQRKHICIEIKDFAPRCTQISCDGEDWKYDPKA